jgi:NAD/NADP transhydrogenase alpha subunit
MRISRTTISAIAVVAMAGFAGSALAAPFVSMGQIVPSDKVELVKKKKKDRPGKCGEFRFYSKKAKKCIDARTGK